MSTLSRPLRIVAEASVPYLRGIIDQVADVTYLPSDQFTAENIRHADALIIRSITRCTPELLQGTQVKLITTATAGFDHIDTAYCDAQGILWRNSPGCNATAVAQYVMCCLSRLALRDDYALTDKVMGIVGVGHVGREVQRLASAMGMRLLLCDPPRAEREGDASFLSLSQLVETCDILTFHVPLTREGAHPSYHLIDDNLLAACAAKRPVLINACRGAVADTAALCCAVDDGRLSSLVVDCWEGEPHISLPLLTRADIATPHIAGFSADGKANGARMCLEAISEVYGVEFPGLSSMSPPPPQQSLISISPQTYHRIERALLATFDPMLPDGMLRRQPEAFEELRKSYHYPREMRAYTVQGVTDSEAAILRGMDFQV